MTNLRIQHHKKEYSWSIPDQWDEVPEEVLLWLCPQLFSYRTKYLQWVKAVDNPNPRVTEQADVDLQNCRIRILLKLLGVKSGWNSRKRAALFSVDENQLADILLIINFVFTDNDRLRAPVSEIRHKGIKYLPPAKSFSNITGSEFHFLDRYYTEYLESRNLEVLTKMLGIIYREAGVQNTHNPLDAFYCGDVRVPFNRFQIELRAKRFARVSPKLKHATFFWYHCFRQQLQKNRKDVFSNSNQKVAHGGTGWLGVFRQLAKHPIHFETIANMKLTSILYELSEVKKEGRQQARFKRNKKRR